MDRSLNYLVDNAATIDHRMDGVASHIVEQLFNHSHKLFDSGQT